MLIELSLMVGFASYAFTLDSNTASSTSQVAILCFCGLRLVPSLQKCAVSFMQMGLCNKALHDLFSLFHADASPSYNSYLNDKKIIKINLHIQKFRIDLQKFNTLFVGITLNTGKVTFITGESGAGKSLFLKALIGHKGEVLHDVLIADSDKHYKITDFKIGYVSQKSVLFDSSIGSNIVFSNNINIIENNIAVINSLLTQVGLDQFSSSDSTGIFL